MPEFIKAQTTLTFDGGSSGRGSLRLVEDTDREVSPSTRTTPKNITVSCDNATYVRLYPPATASTRVVAATGTLSHVGNSTEYDEVDIVTFTPDSPTHELSVGIENVRIELVGTAFDAQGNIINATVSYDQVANVVRVSPAGCYCVCKIKYDADYTLYYYTFAGSCPDNAPTKFDAEGNAIDPLSSAPIKNYEDGLISAIDVPQAAYATLHLEAPVCTYTAISTNFLDTDKEKVVPTLKLEIDPDYPIRLVSNGSGNPSAECCIRAYPAGAVNAMVTTAGVSEKMFANIGVRQVAEVKQFTNASVASLEYPPAGSVSASVVGELTTIGKGSVSFVAGPGDEVVDVTYVEDGNGSYTNPRSRRLGPNEIAVVDMFRHPVMAHGQVTVEYSSTFDRYIYTFNLESASDGSISFTPAFFVVTDALNRASHIKLDPPSMKDKTKSARGG